LIGGLAVRRVFIACGLAVAVACGGGGSAPTAPTAPTPPSTGQPPGVSVVPGVPQFGRNNYIEFVPGDLPVVLSVPHGGALTPADIPNRTGTTTTDLNTIELVRAVSQALQVRTGRAPHVVLCHLRRTKLDANRDLGDAAQGNAQAEQAWREYHGFIDQATRLALARGGVGFYIDLHGHGHDKARLELGYLLSASELDQPDSTLDGYQSRSSLREIAMPAGGFARILRGPVSLGAWFEERGIPAVPSPSTPSPGSDPYFEGGYSTERHTIGGVAGLQLESHLAGVRDTETNRQAFAATLAIVLERFFTEHYRRPL